MPKMRFVLSVEVSISDEGANVNEILDSVSRARDDFGRQVSEAIIEWEQEWIRDRLCARDRQAKKGLGSHGRKDRVAHRCQGRVFTKEGYRSERRWLSTDLGAIGFRVGYVSCRRCGKKFAPILDALGLQPRQRHTGRLEKLIVEAANKTSFARSVEDVEGLAGVPTSKSSSHRWVAGLELPECKPPPLEFLMADGTGYKKAKGARGELRVAIGLTAEGEVAPLGTWSGKTWKQIGKEVQRRLRGRPKPLLSVLDGEPGLSAHFAGLARRTQRSHWHLRRDFSVLLWHDGLKKAGARPFGRQLSEILAVEIPEGEWESILAIEKAGLCDKVREAREKFDEMIEDFEKRGYQHGAEYLRGARERIFTRIDLWLETGIIAPRSTGVIEEIMREVGRRMKKLGWNWKDHGVTQQASMILLRRYSQEQWEEYWKQRLNLRDRCRVQITKLERAA
jgi:hypothetical protein